MFGSKDKSNKPEAGSSAQGDDAPKKGLFGWARRGKPEAEAPAAPAPVEPAAPSAPPAAAAPEPAPARTEDDAAREVAASLFAGLGQPSPDQPVDAPSASAEEPRGFFARMKAGLSKTSVNLGEGMANMFLGEKEIDDELMEEMETRLLTADVGIEATTLIMESLQQRVSRRQVNNRAALYAALQGELERLLADVARPLEIAAEKKPFVILVVGVNGVGKTTTIGKLAKRLQGEGKNVMLAAGDTFRAGRVAIMRAETKKGTPGCPFDTPAVTLARC